MSVVWEATVSNASFIISVVFAAIFMGAGGAAGGTLSREPAEVIQLSTGFGPLRLTADRARGTVEGRFGSAGEGRIVADLVHGMVRGVWTQTAGMHRCPAARFGEADWGTIDFDWPTNGRFAAHWGFCGGEQTLVWEGATPLAH